MKASENNNWLDDALAKAIGSERRRPDFEKWQQEHPEAVGILKSQATRQIYPLSLLEIRRTIMKNPITKLAAAAVIIVAVVVSISVFNKSMPAAFGIEQVIDAYNNVRFLHVKQFGANQQEPAEFWIKSDEQGRVAKARYYLPVTEDGVKLITWTPERAEIWFKSKNAFLVLQTKQIEEWMQSILERCQPKLVMQKLLEHQKAGEVDVDIQKPQDKQKPAVMVATYKIQPIKEIYYIDQATDLITRCEVYYIEGNSEVLNFTMRFSDYNVPIDEKMFSLKDEVPGDVIVADQLNQLIGVPQGNMTDKQAAAETVRQFFQALIDKDYKKAGLIFSGILGEYAKEEFGRFDVTAIVSIGIPVAQPDWDKHGFRVPCELEITNPDGEKISWKPSPYVRPGDDEMHPDRWSITGGIGEPTETGISLRLLDANSTVQDETSAVEGLKFFAEIMDGRYPSRMNEMTTQQEALEAVIKQMNIPPWCDRTMMSDEMRQEMDNKALRLQVPFIFYTKLVREGNYPAYYGDKVTAEFGDSILMRWRVSKDQYRVIFGNLMAADVNADELAKLETMPLNRHSKAIKPTPADGTVGGKVVDLELSWMPGMYSSEHKVYMGTAPDKLELLADVSGKSNAVAPQLQRDTTYYWRVDEIDANGKATTGDIWSFNTGSLVGWWKLDESEGAIAYDSSKGGNNGVLRGNPVWQPSGGAVGGAIQLDGEGDYVEIAPASVFDITQEVTIAVWIQVKEFNMDWQAIVTKGDSAWRLSRAFTVNGLHFACTGLTLPPWVHGTKNVNDGRWHHVVGVFNGAELRLYVDGALDVSVPARGKIATNDFLVMIGENAEILGRKWNGMIDDVRIYNYALSKDEVIELYNSP